MTTPRMTAFRRKVLYIPGYDPIPPRRYRELYRREGAEQSRIAGYRLAIAPRRDPAAFGWGVEGDFAGQPTQADIEVLIWADVVRQSMGRSVAATYAQLIRTAWTYVSTGALWRLTRLRRGPVLAALYPVAMLAAQALVAAIVCGLAFWAVRHVLPRPFAMPVAVLLAAGLGYAVLSAFRRADGRFFAYYLMHDYAFTAQRRGAYPPALNARLAAFADRIAAAVQDDWDEVLVVGHSSGAYLAVSVLADLIRSGRGPDDGRLALLTLGHVVPMAASLPGAHRLRDDLRYLSTRSEVTWIDVTAPGDACCFALCDPVSVAGADGPGRTGPLVLSAAFSRTLSPERRVALRGRWFRLHFQYLCAFDRPEPYDYFAITAGPLRLGERFAGRGHSPARITRPAVPARWRQIDRDAA